MIFYDFDSQALTSPACNKHGFEVAALYTLQYRLARDAEFHSRFQHGQIVRRGLLDDAGAQFFGDADLPRRARSNLFTGDEAFGQPTVDGRGVHAQYLCGLADRDDFSYG